MALIKHKKIKQALEYVAANDWSTESRIDAPVWEHVARALYEHANNPDQRVVGSIGRATRAQKIILERTAGTRRAGTHPAQRSKSTIKFKDMTGGAISE